MLATAYCLFSGNYVVAQAQSEGVTGIKQWEGKVSPTCLCFLCNELSQITKLGPTHTFNYAYLRYSDILLNNKATYFVQCAQQYAPSNETKLLFPTHVFQGLGYQVIRGTRPNYRPLRKLDLRLCTGRLRPSQIIKSSDISIQLKTWGKIFLKKQARPNTEHGVAKDCLENGKLTYELCTLNITIS